ncbi:FadR/GntR family transcriptional regulator [Pseudocolwellia sp. HL-MZ19]|uniref:FadR/GntR family transcriptional regulator n=1 Tax=Pseudocolwellia sp. HL-MZ19 TaxID=3400846 RepID=UPI003CFBAA08
MTADNFNIGQLQGSRSLTNDLVELLRDQIVGGNLQPGTKLPAARDIEEKAGVSRSVVREAVAALRAEGLIISKQGVGMFVAKNAIKKSFEIDSNEFNSIEDAVQILELRMAVELEMATMAAKKRTAKHMKNIWTALNAFDKQIEEGNDAIKEDIAFHLAIADASGNPYFSRFIKYIGEGVIPSREIITEHEQSLDSKEYLAIIQKEHKNIASAIDAKDQVSARAAIYEHLNNSRSRHIQIVKKYKDGLATKA